MKEISIAIVVATYLLIIVMLFDIKDIKNRLPITTNCEIEGLGETKATIIERGRNTITIECEGANNNGN